MSKLDWKSYEELVKDIYEQLGRANGVKILGYGNNCKYTGKSGVEHQIDVLTSHSDGLHDYLTDIECKFWDQHINKDIVMKVHEIVIDCNFSKGIIVSKLGFTPDAVQYAKHVGIGLVELREMTDEDWKGRIRKIQINITASFPELTKVHVEIEENSDKASVIQGRYYGDSQTMFIKYKSGEQTTLGNFISTNFFKFLFDLDSEDEQSKTYLFDDGTLITYSEINKTFRLKALNLSGRISKLSHTSVIEAKDTIYYYMKCIFEEKELLINEDGRIVKQ